MKNAKSKAYESAYLSLLGYSNALKRIVSLIPFNAERFAQRATGILSRETTSKQEDGKIYYRFLDCLNHQGFSTLWDTVNKLSNKVYVIESQYSLASTFFKKLEEDELALKSGIERENYEKENEAKEEKSYLEGANTELKVLRPEAISEVSVIADHLLRGCTVVLNLELLDIATITRMLDFLRGVAYTIDGEIKHVSKSTYIITANGIDINYKA